MAAKGSLSGTVLKTSGSLLYMSAAPCEIPQWGTADAEFKVPSIEDPELAHIISLNPREGPNMATHASPTARHFCHVRFSTFPIHSPLLFQILSLILSCLSFG